LYPTLPVAEGNPILQGLLPVEKRITLKQKVVVYPPVRRRGATAIVGHQNESTQVVKRRRTSTPRSGSGRRRQNFRMGTKTIIAKTMKTTTTVGVGVLAEVIMRISVNRRSRVINLKLPTHISLIPGSSSRVVLSGIATLLLRRFLLGHMDRAAFQVPF
jgi:hypothetical protein